MFRFAARTHPGHRDAENQDAIGSDAEHATWFVADGMGGHAAGSVASGVVKRTLLELAGAVPLDEAVLRAHQAVVADAASEPKHAGMGSTVVAVHFVGPVCTVVWVGDSRAYLWRGTDLQRLTHDHTLVESLRNAQALSDTQIRQHPDRHVVIQTLGMGRPVPSRRDIRLQRGDWILLCSDGLNDELTDATIARILQARPTPDDAGDALIAAALEHGGNDNVSVVLVAYDGKGRAEPATPLQPRTIIWLSVAAGAIAALAIAVLWWFIYGRGS